MSYKISLVKLLTLYVFHLQACLHCNIYSIMSLVADWLSQWAYLGVSPPLSACVVQGSNPTTDTSGIGILIKGRHFPSQKCFIYILHPARSSSGLFVAMCCCCKINKVESSFHNKYFLWSFHVHSSSN